MMSTVEKIKRLYEARDEAIYDTITSMTYDELDDIIKYLQKKELAKTYRLQYFLQDMLEYTIK